MISSHPNKRRPFFRLALDGWPTETIFGLLSYLIRITCPSHLNLSLITALERRIEPHFSHNQLLEILSVSWVPKTIRWQFFWKRSSEFSSAFQSTHASEPYLTTVITVASNILISFRRLPIPPNFFRL